MIETFVQFQAPVAAPNGSLYVARACGGTMGDGMWQGWVEFVPADGGEPIRSPRETTQPNRTDTEYWATGLTPIYLEGALKRALNGPAFGGPAASTEVKPPSAPVHGVLDPFSVYQKGEPLLRKQLAALSAWHLVNIIREHELGDLPVEKLNTTRPPELIEIIIGAVRGLAPRA